MQAQTQEHVAWRWDGSRDGISTLKAPPQVATVQCTYRTTVQGSPGFSSKNEKTPLVWKCDFSTPRKYLTCI